MSTVCGTGTGNFPQPGDPDLNGSILSAAPAFGGIDVSWTFPELNPHAVAYTILYRSTSFDPATMINHRKVTGDFFYDKSTSTSSIEYFYWIQNVSINGTIGDVIGPVSAIARPTIEQVLEDLTSQIDSGHLATGLKTPIDQIDTNKQAIYDEQVARADGDDTMGVAFDQVLAQSDETRALLQEEINARADADGAFVNSVNTLYSDFEGDVAAVQQEMGAHVTTINGDLESIGAYVSFKTDVNGLIGGFGLYNDGTDVEMGFDVDTFWVGRTDVADGIAKGTKPFIISGQEVFIKEAVIQTLTFNKLRADDGSVIVENGKLKAANIDVTNLVAQQMKSSTDVTVGGTTGPAFEFTSTGGFSLRGKDSSGGVVQTPEGMKVYDSNGNLRVILGKL